MFSEMDPEDWFGLLPEDLIVDILSHLKISEASITGTLSKRWRNLWKHRLAVEFTSPSHARGDIRLLRGLREFIIIGKLEDWSDEAQKTHHWLDSAISIGTSNLEVWLIGKVDELPGRDRHMTLAGRQVLLEKGYKRFQNTIFIDLPAAFGSTGHCTEHISLSYVNMGMAYGRNRSLKTLFLYECKISEEALECSVRNCTVLESLILVGCQWMMGGKVRIESESLKELAILDTWMQIKEVNVNAPHLWELRSAELLEKLTLTRKCGGIKKAIFFQSTLLFLKDIFSRKAKELLGHIHLQISFLRINLDILDFLELNRNHELPACYHWKNLKLLCVDGFLRMADSHVIAFLNLINSCPQLIKIQLDFTPGNDIDALGLPTRMAQRLGFTDYKYYDHPKRRRYFKCLGSDTNFEPLHKIKIIEIYALLNWDEYLLEKVQLLLINTPNLESLSLIYDTRPEERHPLVNSSFTLSHETKLQMLENVSLLPRASKDAQIFLR